MKLFEILQDSYPYTWRHAGKYSMASFTSSKSGVVDVEFEKINNEFDESIQDTAVVVFSTEHKEGWVNFALTNDGDHLMILSTVIKIIKEYADTQHISKLEFEAKGGSRRKVYDYLARRFAKLYNFSIKKDDRYDESKFRLIKNPA